jgi:HTH-type transcriptional regulator/antitoxin MqsA
VFDPESAQRYAAAGDALVLQSRKREQRELKRIRQKLDLTQQAAAEITGGGHNAFSRYERGTAQPMPAVVNLFRILDRHPELLREILPQRARKRRASSSASQSAQARQKALRTGPQKNSL